MSRIASGVVVFAIFFVVSVVSTYRAIVSTGERLPSSYEDVRRTVLQFEKDLDDPRVFNEKTASAYIHQFADQAYGLNGADYTPSNEQEIRQFLKHADLTVETLFALRLQLSRKLQQFEERNQWTPSEKADLISAIRRAHLYLRYAEDFVVNWRHRLQPLKLSSRFFAGEGPLTLRNPQFLGRNEEVRLKAGDILLVRGDSFVSGTISRIGDVVTNMSHLAMVAEAEDGTLKVVEALMEKGLVQYDVDRFLSFEALPRAAVYRYQDSDLARSAAKELWAVYQDSVRYPEKYQFDIQMDPNDHSKIYCAEAVKIAWEMASGGKIDLPRYQTTFHEAIETDFAKGIQMRVARSFAPSDIEMDTRFTLVVEHRDLTLLENSRRYDVVLSRLFEKFKTGFTYKPDLAAGAQGLFAIFARNLGFMESRVPVDATVGTLTTLIRHKRLVTALMEDLEAAEKNVSLQRSRPLSYRELEELFEKICGGDCVERKSDSQLRTSLSRNLSDPGARATITLGTRCEAAFRQVD